MRRCPSILVHETLRKIALELVRSMSIDDALLERILERVKTTIYRRFCLRGEAAATNDLYNLSGDIIQVYCCCCCEKIELNSTRWWITIYEQQRQRQRCSSTTERRSHVELQRIYHRETCQTILFWYQSSISIPNITLNTLRYEAEQRSSMCHVWSQFSISQQCTRQSTVCSPFVNQYTPNTCD